MGASLSSQGAPGTAAGGGLEGTGSACSSCWVRNLLCGVICCATAWEVLGGVAGLSCAQAPRSMAEGDPDLTAWLAVPSISTLQALPLRCCLVPSQDGAHMPSSKLASLSGFGEQQDTNRTHHQ